MLQSQSLNDGRISLSSIPSLRLWRDGRKQSKFSDLNLITFLLFPSIFLVFASILQFPVSQVTHLPWFCHHQPDSWDQQALLYHHEDETQWLLDWKAQ